MLAVREVAVMAAVGDRDRDGRERPAADAQRVVIGVDVERLAAVVTGVEVDQLDDAALREAAPRIDAPASRSLRPRRASQAGGA
ncbi:MAG TPA: hypothetical protein VFZ84_01235 [Burkholderiales bacterium]